MLRWLSRLGRWLWSDPRRRLYFITWVFTLGPVSYGMMVNLAYQFYYLNGNDWPPAIAHIMHLHLQVVSTQFYGTLTMASLSICPPLLYFGIPAIPFRSRRARPVQSPERDASNAENSSAATFPKLRN